MSAPERTKERFGRDWATDFDMEDPVLEDHWEEVIEDLQGRCPVAHSEVGEGYWLINKYEDIVKCAQDWETFSSRDGYMPNRPDDMPLWFPVECDPPLHDELRAAINKYLAPKRILPFEPQIRGFTDQLIDAFIADGETEVVKNFAGPLPGMVFCALIANIPVEDMPYLQGNLHLGLVGPQEGRVEALGKALTYLTEFLERRAEEPPQDDIVNAVLTADIPGYDFGDKAGTLSQLTLGGTGTTGHVIASAILYMARNPEAAERYRNDPACRPRAVEEFVRAYAPAPWDGRRIQRPVEVAGVKMEPGDFALLGYGLGSRDPAVTPEPNRVDFDRSPNRHLGFGAGIHRCVGSHLARLQIRIGLETFMERVPDVSVADDFKPPHMMGMIRAITSLPVSFTPGTPLNDGGQS